MNPLLTFILRRFRRGGATHESAYVVTCLGPQGDAGLIARSLEEWDRPCPRDPANDNQKQRY